MTDRKMTILRLVIFLLLAFIPFWVILPNMNAHYGGPVYMSEEAAAAVYALGTFGMLIPSAAHLLTRLLTKEGFQNTYLSINIKGNAKWYLSSVWVMLLESMLVALLLWKLFAGHLTITEALPTKSLKAVIAMVLLQIAFSLIIVFPAFGEEWGWRGYMMPKLMKLMPTSSAVVIGGILWGLWHAPLTIAGHNFGVDYWGYPWWGIVQMCLMCIAMNAFLTLLTEKTKSVYPASFAHMLNNNLGPSVLLLLAGSESLNTALEQTESSTFMTVFLPIIIITGAISMVLLMKDSSK